MKIRLTKSLALVAGLSLGLVPVGLSTAGAAATGADRAPSSAVARHDAATTKAAQKRVEEYWTPARMKNAIPVGVKVTPQKGKPGGGTSGATAVAESPQPVFGKVFFTEGNANYVCSGTATTSTNQSVVTTAGHCVNEGPGAFVTNFAFYPAYNSGASSYGVWTARALFTTNQWATAGDFNYDVGFAVMNKNASGQTLTSVTGSYAMGYGIKPGTAVKAYGYPAARPYDGRTLWSCSGTTIADTYGGSTDVGLPCTMTGGSSGGGWIANGKLSSVTSFGYTGVKNILWGPTFGNVVQATFNTAQGS